MEKSTNKITSPDIYQEEYIFLEQAQKILDNPDLSEEILEESYNSLLIQYKSLLRKIVKMTKVSDRTQRHLHDANDRIKEQQQELLQKNGLLEQEIIERTALGKKLQQRNQQLSLLNQLGRMFSSSLDLEQVLHNTLTEIHRLLEAFSASVWLLNHEGNELICRKTIGIGRNELMGRNVPVGQGIIGWVAQQKESLVCDDILVDSRHHNDESLLDGYELRSMLAVPLQVKGSIIGVLTVVDPEINHFRNSDLQFAELIAISAAIAIENARLYSRLQKSHQLIRHTFGRYLAEEVVQTILDTPDGMKLGGDQQRVTIMMADIRGFTAICEELSAEDVVTMLNQYFNVMTDILFKYQGTIDDFIGDAILAMFGAPIPRDDDVQRAIACAVEMQLAMTEVNQRNQEAGFPQLKMGIGIHTGEAVVGNFGSHKRTKYSVVGKNVNLAARIESYSVGGQILISEETLQACNDPLRIDGSLEVEPKGVTDAITIYEVGGIRGEFNVYLPEKRPSKFISLSPSLEIKFSILDGKHTGDRTYRGRMINLSETEADLEAERSCRPLTNLKIALFDRQHCITEKIYAKVTEVSSQNRANFRVSFTSLPSEIERLFKSLLSAADDS